VLGCGFIVVVVGEGECRVGVLLVSLIIGDCDGGIVVMVNVDDYWLGGGLLELLA
jgi:hypothetical protein